MPWLARSSQPEAERTHRDRTPIKCTGVDLVPSSKWLDNAEAVMMQVGAEEADNRLAALSALLEELPADHWDFVFLDCPPTFGFLMNSALRATSEVLVPVEISSSAVPGLRDLILTLRASVEYNPRISLAGILACRVLVVGHNWAVVCRELVDEMRAIFGSLVFQNVIRENIKLRETCGHGLPITAYDPEGNGAADYRLAARELLSRKAQPLLDQVKKPSPTRVAR